MEPSQRTEQETSQDRNFDYSDKRMACKRQICLTFIDDVVNAKIFM